MKKFKTLLLLAASLLGSLSLLAQTPEPTFFIVETMKTMPGKDADYVKTEREVWKKLHQERIKRGLIGSWSLYAVRYPAGTDAAYDFVTVTRVDGMKKLENPWGTMFDDAEKMLTKAEYTAAMNIGLLRNLTNSSVFYIEDYVAADPKATTPSKYQMINKMKVMEGKSEAYLNMEKKVVRPLHVEMMKSGGRAAWGLYSLVMPNGANQPFNYVTSDFYNKWEDIAAAGSYAKTLAKVHPGMTAKAFEKQIFDSRSLVEQELWELIDFAR